MSRSHRHALGCLLVMVVGAGCSVGPDYEPPKVALPGQFSAPDENHSAEPDLAKWWQRFDDPVLNRLIDQALNSNLDLKLAEARVREARAIARESYSGFLPDVTTSASYARSRASKNANNSVRGNGGNFDDNGNESDSGSSGTPSTLSTRVRNLYDAGFDANWELDIFGGVRREVEAALAGEEAEVEARRSTLIALLAEVSQSYLQLRGLQRRIALTEDNIKAEEETLNLQRIKLRAGIASDLTVAQAEAQLETTKSQLPALQAPTSQTMHRLSILLGQEPNALIDLLTAAAAIPKGPPSVPAGLPSELLRRRPDVRQAERQLAAATANIGVATADLFPKLSLTGNFGVRSQNSAKLFSGNSRYWSFGPSIDWEILNWPAVLSNIEVQNARQEQALIHYKQTVLQSLEDVENSLVAYDRERARYESLAASVVANHRALDLAKKLYSAGLVDFLNVLNAQQAVYQSEDQRAQSEQTVSTNLISLYKALGGGWEEVEAGEAATNP